MPKIVEILSLEREVAIKQKNHTVKMTTSLEGKWKETNLTGAQIIIQELCPKSKFRG